MTDIERKYEIKLPAQYRKFLCRYNGGYTPKTKFNAGKISSDIRFFWGVGEVKFSFDNIELGEWLERDVFPVACDSFGNYIVIGLNKDNAGKIYFCDHEKGNKAEYIAGSLKDFLRCCKSEKISEATRRSVEEREEALIAKGRGNIITDDLRKLWQEEINKYGSMVQEKVIID
ncbi:MAG: SMI1/KNR4 family protein [Clostridium sp.]|nr:SMI1/KNR4 family protein [Clostridium sp.]